MSAVQIILLCVCGLSAVGFIIARVLKGGILGVLIKTLASFCFVSSGIIGLILNDSCQHVRWAIGIIVIGLLFGMIGDIVLDLKVVYPGNDKFYLNGGMLSFFLGHVCYIIGFSIYSTPIERFTSVFNLYQLLLIAVGIAIILTAMTILVSKKMKLDFGKYLLQTIGYSFILMLSTTYAILLSAFGVELWIAVVGLILFLLSDLVLSMQYFGGKIDSKPLIAINHGLYYGAQILIVACLFML